MIFCFVLFSFFSFFLSKTCKQLVPTRCLWSAEAEPEGCPGWHWLPLNSDWTPPSATTKIEFPQCKLDVEDLTHFAALFTNFTFNPQFKKLAPPLVVWWEGGI